MDDPLLAGRVARPGSDRHEQLQAGPDREPQAVAVVGDRLALDQLHHEERLAKIRSQGDVGSGSQYPWPVRGLLTQIPDFDLRGAAVA